MTIEIDCLYDRYVRTLVVDPLTSPRRISYVARSCFYLDASELGAVSEMTAEPRTKGALLVF